MIFELFYLALIGFTVGLSGALIPGPLLVYTISQSVKEGRWTGLKVIAGHMLVEVAILGLIYLGVSRLLSSQIFFKSTSILGGVFLAAMAWNLYRKPFRLKSNTKNRKNTFLGGILFTALNPSFPLWWATVGSRLLLEGFNKMGSVGALTVVLGHWIADLAWYLLVSMSIAIGSQKLLEKQRLKKLRNILATALLILALYFLHTGFFN